MPGDDLRFGDIKPGSGSPGTRLEWAVQILIQLMVLAVVVYAFIEVMLVLWF